MDNHEHTYCLALTPPKCFSGFPLLLNDFSISLLYGLEDSFFLPNSTPHLSKGLLGRPLPPSLFYLLHSVASTWYALGCSGSLLKFSLLLECIWAVFTYLMPLQPAGLGQDLISPNITDRTKATARSIWFCGLQGRGGVCQKYTPWFSDYLCQVFTQEHKQGLEATHSLTSENVVAKFQRRTIELEGLVIFPRGDSPGRASNSGDMCSQAQKGGTRRRACTLLGVMATAGICAVTYF